MAAGPHRDSTPTPETRAWALAVVERAYVDGQIGDEEHDERVAGVLAADNRWRLERWIDDLQVPADLPRPVAPPSVQQREASARRRARTLRHGVVAAVAALLLGGVGVAVAALRTDDSSSTAQDQLRSGLADFRDAYREEFGTSVVGRVQIDPEWATVEVPVDEQRGRYEQWVLRDGRFSKSSEARGGAGGWVDLDDVDVEATDRHVASAARTLGLQDPSHLTIVIGARAGADGQVMLVLRNEYGESATLVTDTAGRVLREEPFTPPRTQG